MKLPIWRIVFFIIIIPLLTSPHQGNAEECRYLAVVPDSTHADALAPLLAWKEKIGFSTCVARLDTEITAAFPDDPDDATRIYHYLQEEVPGRGIDYVLLGGDVDVLPQRLLYPDGKPGQGLAFGSDYYYANLNQPDWDVDGDGRWGEWQQDQVSLFSLPEVVVSRVPLAATELASWASNAVSWESGHSQNNVTMLLAHGITDYSTRVPDLKTDGGLYSLRLQNGFLDKYPFTVTTAHEMNGLSPSSLTPDQPLGNLPVVPGRTLISLNAHGAPNGMTSYIWPDDTHDPNNWNPGYKDKSGAFPEIASNNFRCDGKAITILQGCSTAPVTGKDPGFADSSLRSRYFNQIPANDNGMLKSALLLGSPAVSGSSAGSEYGANWASDAETGSQTLHYWFTENFLDRGMLWGDAFFQAQSRYWQTRGTGRAFRVFNIFGDPALNFRGVQIDQNQETERVHRGPYHDFSGDWEHPSVETAPKNLYVLVIHDDQQNGTVYVRDTELNSGWTSRLTFDASTLGYGPIIDSEIIFTVEVGRTESRVLHVFLACERGLVDLRFHATSGQFIAESTIDVSGDMIRQVAAYRETNTIHLAWTAVVGAEDTVRYSHSNDFGERWRAPANFSGFHSPDITADESGRVHLVAVKTAEPRLVHMNSSPDQGVNWPGWVMLGKDGDYLHQSPSVAVATEDDRVVVVMSSQRDSNSFSLEMAQAIFPNPAWQYSSLAATPSFDYVQPDVRASNWFLGSDDFSLAYAQDSAPGENRRLIFGRQTTSDSVHLWSSPRKVNVPPVPRNYQRPLVMYWSENWTLNYGIVYGGAQEEGIYFAKVSDNPQLTSAVPAFHEQEDTTTTKSGDMTPATLPTKPNIWWETSEVDGVHEVTAMLADDDGLTAAVNVFLDGENFGRVVHSHDGGLNWQFEEGLTNCRALFTLITTLDSQVAGGVQQDDADPYGAIYKKSGAGIWELVQQVDGPGVSSLYRDAEGRIWAGTGESGILYRSDDNGDHFTEVYRFGNGWSLLAIVDWQGLLMVGLRGSSGGSLMVSNDDGVSWSQSHGFESLQAVNDIIVHGNAAYAAVRESHQAAVYQADSSGLAWTMLPPMGNFDVYNVRTLESAPDGGLLAGIARDWGRSESAVLRFANGSWELAGSYLDMADTVTDIVFHKQMAYAGTGSVYGNIFMIDMHKLAPDLLAGDVNGDTQVSLADAVLALQVSTGRQPIGVTPYGDCNFDGEIGLTEALCALQVMAAESHNQ